MTPRRARARVGRLALVIDALAALAICRMALRILGYRETLRRFATPRDHRCPPVSAGDLGSIEAAVVTAARLLPGGHNCLLRSLATCRLCARRGYTATIRFGVRRDHQGYLMHAWVAGGSDDQVKADLPRRFLAFLPRARQSPRARLSAPAAAPRILEHTPSEKP